MQCAMASEASDCCYKCWFLTPGKQNGSVLCGNRRELWGIFKEKILPLATIPAEDVWIMMQLILSFITLGFSIGTITRGSNTIFDIVQVSIASFFTLAASIDAGIRIVWRCCCIACKSENLQTDDEENQTQGDGGTELNEVNQQPSNAHVESTDSRIEQYKPNDQDNDESKERRKKISDLMKLREGKEIGKCISACQNIIRMFSDIVLYPIIMCTILKHASNKNREGLDFNRSKYEGAKFIFLLCMYAIFYIVRLIIIIVALKSVKKCLNGEDCFSFWRFSSVLVLHYIGQCFLQVIIVVGIWIRIEFEYDSLDGKPFLWCSVVLGYFVPCVGFFAIFIPEYYYIEELLIKSYTNNDNDNKLNVEYTEKSCCCLKWLYTFISPLLAVLSIFYFLFLSSFALFSLLGYDYYVVDGLAENAELSTIWIIYYFSMIFCITLINIQVLLIAIFWFMIICMILSALAAAFFVVLFGIYGLILSLPYLLLGLFIYFVGCGCMTCVCKAFESS